MSSCKSTARTLYWKKLIWESKIWQSCKVTTCWCHLLMNQLCQVEAFGIPTSKSVKLLNENQLVDQLQNAKMKTNYMCKMKTKQSKRTRTISKPLEIIMPRPRDELKLSYLKTRDLQLDTLQKPNTTIRWSSLSSKGNARQLLRA